MPLVVDAPDMEVICHRAYTTDITFELNRLYLTYLEALEVDPVAIVELNNLYTLYVEFTDNISEILSYFVDGIEDADFKQFSLYNILVNDPSNILQKLQSMFTE